MSDFSDAGSPEPVVMPLTPTDWPGRERGLPPPPVGSAAEAHWLNAPRSALRAGDARAHLDIDSPGILKMAIIGVILTVITLGIYRFWFIVRLRQNLWSRVRLAGSTFDYAGTVGEVFRGFLVALLYVAPLWALYAGGSALLNSPQYQVAAGVMTLAAVVGFSLFLSFASYRGHRYRVSRTIWRGVRFRQTGSGTIYALLSAVLWIPAIVTLGLAIPFNRALLERYSVNHMWFGDGKFESKASGGAVYGRFALYYAVIVVPIALIVVTFIVYMPPNMGDVINQFAKFMAESFIAGKQHTQPPNEPISSWGTPGDRERAAILVILGVLGFLWLMFVPIILWPIYRAREVRSFIGRISFGEARFTSSFSALNLYGSYIIFLLICSGIGTGVGIVSGLVLAVGAGLNSPVVIGISVFIGYFLFIVATWALRIRLFLFGLTAKLVDSITVIGIEHMENVTSNPDNVSALGDDFAGGFDIGAI